MIRLYATAIFALNLNLPSADALPLFRGRIMNRTAAFCATLFTATREVGLPGDLGDARAAIDQFRASTFNAPAVADPTVTTSAVVATSGSSIAIKQRVEQRTADLERAIKTSRGRGEVIAVAHLPGANRIDAYTDVGKATRERYADSADRSPIARPRGSTPWPRYLGVYAKGLAWFPADLIVYADVGPIISIFAAFNSLILGYIAVDVISEHPAELWSYLSLAPVGLAGAVGAIDFPVRHFQSYQFGFRKLTKALARFAKGKDDWMYWSRDLTVSPEFIRDLLVQEPTEWRPTLRDEDYRELTSGLYRVLTNANRSKSGREFGTFSVDVLGRRIDGEIEVTVVIRSSLAAMSSPGAITSNDLKAAPSVNVGQPVHASSAVEGH